MLNYPKLMVYNNMVGEVSRVINYDEFYLLYMLYPNKITKCYFTLVFFKVETDGLSLEL